MTNNINVREQAGAALRAAVMLYQARYGLRDWEVARKLGVARPTWSNIRKGKRPISLAFARSASRQAEFRSVAKQFLRPAP